MELLSLIPARTWLMLGAFFILSAALGSQTLRLEAAASQTEALRAQLQAEHSRQLAAINQAAAERAAMAAARGKTMQEARDAEQIARQAAQADARAARATADGLRQRVAELASAAGGGACPGDPRATERGAAAAGAGDLLAELLGRLDQAAGELAEYADQARVSGQLCERSYEALKQTGSKPGGQ